MSDIISIKEVYFDVYCPLCKNKETPEDVDPCNDCLGQGSNENTHKPVRYKRDISFSAEDEKEARDEGYKKHTPGGV